MKNNHHVGLNRGYIALLGVLIVVGLGTLVVVATLLLGVLATKSSLLLTQSDQAKALATACAEESLAKIRVFLPFTGTSTLSLGMGSCSAVVINTGGTSRVIDSTGTVGTIVRRVKVMVSALNPQITVSSWQEVSAF